MNDRIMNNGAIVRPGVSWTQSDVLHGEYADRRKIGLKDALEVARRDECVVSQIEGVYVLTKCR